MNLRPLWATLLGAVVYFVWASIAHMFLGLGELGMQPLPNETPALTAMHTMIGDTSGMYVFPDPKPFNNDMAKYQDHLNTVPSGLLIYHPPGARAMTPGQLVTEFFTELAEVALAVLVVVRAGMRGFGCRFALVLAMGLLTAISTNVSYWNWYGFPLSYTLGYMTVQLVAFALAGLVIAAIVKPVVAVPQL